MTESTDQVTLEEAKEAFGDYRAPAGYVCLVSRAISRKTASGIVKGDSALQEEFEKRAREGFLLYSISDKESEEREVGVGEYVCPSIHTLGGVPPMLLVKGDLELRVMETYSICLVAPNPHK